TTGIHIGFPVVAGGGVIQNSFAHVGRYVAVQLGDVQQYRPCPIGDGRQHVFEADTVVADRTFNGRSLRHLDHQAPAQAVAQRANTVVAQIFGKPVASQIQVLNSDVLVHSLHQFDTFGEFGLNTGFEHNARLLPPEQIRHHNVKAQL